MSKVFLLAVFFSSFVFVSFAQDSSARIFYIIDSIPVIQDPEKGDNILQEDVADLTVIKNKDSLQRLGYEKWDGVIYLFTKEYRNRPDSLRQIPSVKQMKRVNGVWLFNNSTYTGRFIDYYYSGKKKGEGILQDGKLIGHRVQYYQDGNISSESEFENGIANGLHKEYFSDGSIKQKGVFANGNDDGIWENYYPNGQVAQHSTFKNGNMFDSTFTYYSTGKIKERVFVKNGKMVPDPALVKIYQLMNKSDESNKDGDTKAAIKYCSKVIESDSTYADAYFSRGTLKLNEFMFDDAIADFDKALTFEPYLDVALTNRAFARIRKYQFANSRTLSKNKDVTVMASADKVSVPPDEQEKICSDLYKAVFLGDKSDMIDEALANYCSAEKKK